VSRPSKNERTQFELLISLPSLDSSLLQALKPFLNCLNLTEIVLDMLAKKIVVPMQRNHLKKATKFYSIILKSEY
jgi:hypothetical protein